MISPLPYDASFQPPAPVVPVGVSALGADPVVVAMLIDTGADVTLLPAELVRQLRLPQVDTIMVSGFGGARLPATVHAAALVLGSIEIVARVVASGEALLGRDVLAHFELELDGPRSRLTLRPPTRAPRARTAASRHRSPSRRAADR